VIGVRLGPYEIVAPIDVGGMGEVYRARDSRLGREVAVKVLPAEFAADPDRLRRFEQEAGAAAALNHPNILVLLDVGRHDGQPYLVTELLEGTTLRELVATGSLTVSRSVELGIQLAKGLAAAHEKGIVHRDLKPGNVFVTKDGTVKILDFGLAKLTQPISDAGGAAAGGLSGPDTASGLAVGTVGYMAPEQIRLQAVDQRADIFAFGCVLYEMLSGRRAFSGETPADTMSAILSQDPKPLSGVVGRPPSALEQLVRRCVAKRPDDRFQSAHDLVLVLPAITEDRPLGSLGRAVAWLEGHRAAAAVVVALVALAGAGGLWLANRPAPAPQGAGPARIVVFPFDNLGSPEDAYFASGMAEEITSRLANVRGLGVISRTTATGYERKGKTIKDVGNDLRVDFVLEGSVRLEHGNGGPSRVRISPQLIRVADDTHVWSERYDRVLADVFAIQSEVAESAVMAMGVALLPAEQTAMREISTSDLEAYQLYLRGRELFLGGEDRARLEGAVSLYQAAIDRDPKFAQAFAGLARSHLTMYWLHYDRSQARLARGLEAADRAVELAPYLAEAHVALGYGFYFGFLDYPRALNEFAVATTIQPNNADAAFGTGAVLRRQGRWGDSAEVLSRALELDPNSASCLYSVARSCVLARRYREAERHYDRAIALSPQWAAPYALKAWLQIVWRGDVNRARTILDEAGRVVGMQDDEMALPIRGSMIWRASRDYGEALRQLERGPRTILANQYFYLPIALLRGQLERLAGKSDAGRGAFQAAKTELEQRIKEAPADARFHSSLGVAYAGLGKPDDAVREALLGCELMPASKEASKALCRLEDLAVVYTMVGRQAEAVSSLDDLLGRSGEWTPHVIRLDPRWDPLRADPRFEALLLKYEVKE